MHILYLHQHFALPSGSTGTRSYEFSSRWVRAGHKVTVITGCTDSGGLSVGKDFMSDNGIDIYISRLKYSNKHCFISRVICFLRFIFFAFFKGLKVKNVDVVYATSTPLTIGVSAVLLKWTKKMPFFFEVRDQWPEIPIEMGIIKNPLMKWLLKKLEKLIYHNSSGIVALSPGMARGVEKILSGSDNKVIVAPNCADLEIFRPDIDAAVVRRKYGWNDKFILMHCGAMGKVNNLDFVIDVANKLKSYRDIMFVLIGDGNQKKQLRKSIGEKNIDNVEILDSVPKVRLPDYVAAADICMVVIGDYPVLQHNSANKFFDSLSSGKPVLLNYSGWQRKELEDAKAGFGTELCNLEEFVGKIMELYNNKQMLSEMGANARKLAEQKFSRDKIAAEVLEFITTQHKQ